MTNSGNLNASGANHLKQLSEQKKFISGKSRPLIVSTLILIIILILMWTLETNLVEITVRKERKTPDLQEATYEHTHFVTFYLDSFFIKLHLSSYLVMPLFPFLELLLQIDGFLVLKPFQNVSKQLNPSTVESSYIPTLILLLLVPIELFYNTLARNVM